MAAKKEEFLKRLLATFRVEADEHIKSISSGLIKLEKSTEPGEQAAIIEVIYREAHSLKGAARSVNIRGIETVCQHLESLFQEFKHRPFRPDPCFFDILHRAVDTIDEINRTGINEIPQEGRLVGDLEMILKGECPEPHQIGDGKNIDNERDNERDKGKDKEKDNVEDKKEKKGKKEAKPDKREERQAILQAVEGRLRKKRESKQAPEQVVEKLDDIRAKTIRLSTRKLDSVLLQSEEMIYGKLSLNRIFEELVNIRGELDSLQKSADEGTLRLIRTLQGKLRDLSRSLDADRRTMGILIDTHLEDMKELLMMPFSTLTVGFPKTVRDIARDKGKQAEIVIHGADREIDKRVLEALKAPLVHLLRNAVDHGIETPKERLRLNKNPQGTITLTITRLDSSKIEVRLSDDGGGIDLDRVRLKSLESDIVSKEKLEKLTDDEVLELIFRSEFSTSPLITDLSGRGLGLAIVRENIEKIGGEITIHSELRKGTEFRMILPLTLATFRGVLVKSGDHRFIVPTINVERVIRVPVDEIKTIENRETIIIDQKAVSYVPLDYVLALSGGEQIDRGNQFVQMLILSTEGKRIAFSVDEIQEEQEVLVKDLGRQLRRVINIAGAAILSSTDVVPILNVSDLLKSAVHVTAGGTARKIADKKPKAKEKTVLLVEDSITSRILLKNILESAGYRVRVAVDGMDGWTSLKENPVDVVVSDVDMPRLSGFQLTSRIREDKVFAHTPVVLVTALEKREDREKGIEVGANAYIVKSSFDQSNLLGVLNRIV